MRIIPSLNLHKVEESDTQESCTQRFSNASIASNTGASSLVPHAKRLRSTLSLRGGGIAAGYVNGRDTHFALLMQQPHRHTNYSTILFSSNNCVHARSGPRNPLRCGVLQSRIDNFATSCKINYKRPLPRVKCFNFHGRCVRSSLPTARDLTSISIGASARPLDLRLVRGE